MSGHDSAQDHTSSSGKSKTRTTSPGQPWPNLSATTSAEEIHQILKGKQNTSLIGNTLYGQSEFVYGQSESGYGPSDSQGPAMSGQDSVIDYPRGRGDYSERSNMVYETERRRGAKTKDHPDRRRLESGNHSDQRHPESGFDSSRREDANYKARIGNLTDLITKRKMSFHQKMHYQWGGRSGGMEGGETSGKGGN